jgi:hypothetical protein
MPADFLARENICRCFVQRNTENVYVLSVIFADEARFVIDCIINIHNQHQWAEEDSHCAIHCVHQQQFSINVWAWIVSDYSVGPHRFTGNHYRDFLLHELSQLLECVPVSAEHECGTCIIVR